MNDCLNQIPNENIERLNLIDLRAVRMKAVLITHKSVSEFSDPDHQDLSLHLDQDSRPRPKRIRFSRRQIAPYCSAALLPVKPGVFPVEVPELPRSNPQ